MSRIMSHREAKAAARVIGDHSARVAILELVVAALLKRQDLDILVTAKGEVELVDLDSPKKTEPEMTVRELGADE